jgi:hypothetical protein
MKSERGEVDRVGATIFPGLVKISKAPTAPNGEVGENTHVCILMLSAAWELTWFDRLL